jgi:hypothetical protein
MAQRTRSWTIAIATAGLVALPLIGAAQTYPPSGSTSGQSTSGTTTSEQTSSNENSPQFHLDQAKKALDGVSISSLSGDAATRISTLKTNFDNLYNDYKSQAGGASSTGSQVGTSGSSSANPPAGSSSSSSTTSDWRTEYTQITQALDRLNIPATSPRGASSSYGSSGSSGSMSGTTGSGSVSGTSGSSGQTGTSGSAMSSTPVTIPADVRAKLSDFRMHLDEFYKLAASGGVPPSSASM